QTVASPEIVTAHGQALDPRLRLSLPRDAIDPITVRQFEAETQVAVTIEPQTSESRLLLDLAAGEQGKLDVALVDAPTLGYLIQQRLVEPIDRTLVAAGRAWSASGRSDLEAARRVLLRARDGLHVGGSLDSGRLGRGRLAAIRSGLGFRNPRDRTKFVVPLEGSVIRMRSYCILA